ncbi:putative leucine-rich repeat receptor serine/threonine-protein kinase [Spatholobus suberectus]|nr:putative leucine-rich repeat receptor serine/threonine-protein kinase [Spatholobus suberectus]
MMCLFRLTVFLFFFLDTVHSRVQEKENAGIVNGKSSLISFMSGIVSDPQNSLVSWKSPGVHVCDWSGVRCNNASDMIIELDLSGRSLGGTISPALANISSLQILDLSGNFLVDHIPKELGYLAQLGQLSLSGNILEGHIPSEFGSLHNLYYLDMGSNHLEGEIPPSLFCNGTSLSYVDLSNNSLRGQIPLNNECILKELRFLLLWSNNLVGQVPLALSNYTKLKWLDLELNMLSGELPSRIVRNWPQLQFLYLSYNYFASHDGNTNLEPFFASLRNLSYLQELELAGNNLSGKLPHNIDLSRNKLSGSIPDSFANLPQLRRLLLYDNLLSGPIPPGLGKCVNLEILDLSHNDITGLIHAEVAALSSLKLYLNLSNNNLHGPLPLELSKMDMVLAIDVSMNNLSGSIPPQLESCTALEYLNLSGNSFEGPLPYSLGQLLYIRALDVSSNQLRGAIPESLQLSSSLKDLNFSFNKFSGNVSNEGAFSNLTIDSFLGNSGLCGPFQGMQQCHKKHSYHLVFLLIPVLLFGTPLLCMCFRYSMVIKSKVRKRFAIVSRGDLEDVEEGTKELKYPRISYRQLREATGRFSASSLIGSGRFGQVYKGMLQDNTRIAVKVLDTTAGEISRSFRRECQILKKIRHRNLIRIITICCRPEFNALVFPLMPNGSLERHLYPSQRLDVVQLVRICSDVAEGMSYLHHYSPVKVVHCDLKPSNILLDEDMTALVTDFGIARLLQSDESTSTSNSASFSSTHGLLCGSVGYIAPELTTFSQYRFIFLDTEYGMGKHASTEGDVYSFGVLVLEMVSGRLPTDVLSHEGSSLCDWVKRQYTQTHQLQNFVEQALQRCFPCGVPSHHHKIWKDVILELIELGLLCTQHNPSTRPSMLDIAQEMGMLKDYLTKSTLTRHSSQSQH